MLALETVGLSKSYSRLWGAPRPAVDGVSLQVPRGACFGLIGPNGAGKTTFIKLLLGVLRPQAGQLHVLDGSPDDVRVRRRVGYLPERLYLPEAYTPRTFLASVAALKQVPWSRARSEALLLRVGLELARERRIRGFSKGMRQRLGLAGALVGDPELLVLDEPTDGIDPLGRVDVRRVLLEERARGATVLLNSHLLAESERVCDRIGILYEGRLLREGTLEALTAGTGGYDARFEGAAPAALEGAGFVDARPDGRCRFTESDPGRLNAALDAARASGARLVELSPRVKDLESVLAEVVPKGGVT